MYSMTNSDRRHDIGCVETVVKCGGKKDVFFPSLYVIQTEFLKNVAEMNNKIISKD